MCILAQFGVFFGRLAEHWNPEVVKSDVRCYKQIGAPQIKPCPLFNILFHLEIHSLKSVATYGSRVL